EFTKVRIPRWGQVAVEFAQGVRREVDRTSRAEGVELESSAQNTQHRGRRGGVCRCGRAETEPTGEISGILGLEYRRRQRICISAFRLEMSANREVVRIRRSLGPGDVFARIQ